jgi:hypothetical protein
MSDSPFVGPRPFEKEDSDRFFGRTREIEELLSLIIAHRAVLVYAQSGAGKSSLLRAGVIKRLEEQQYQVLRSARVHGLLPNDVPPESVQNILFTMRFSTGRQNCRAANQSKIMRRPRYRSS